MTVAVVTPAWCAGFWRGRALTRQQFAEEETDDELARLHLAKAVEYEAAALAEARG